MAYFKSNEQEETRRNPSLPDEPGANTGSSWEEHPEDDYDDGFDEPYEDEDSDGLPELSEEASGYGSGTTVLLCRPWPPGSCQRE